MSGQKIASFILILVLWVCLILLLIDFFVVDISFVYSSTTKIVLVIIGLILNVINFMSE